MFFIRRYLDVIIKRARMERHLSQKKLIEQIGDHKISLRTLRRIEQGDPKVRELFVQELLDFFGLDLQYVLRDDYEDDLVRRWLKVEDCSVQECIEEINAQIEKYRVLFHRGQSRYKDYHITTLPEFLIYYPLMDALDLNNALFRLGGDIQGRFNYLLEQMEWIYRSIPDSELKTAADDLVKCIWDEDYPLAYENYQKYKDFLDEKTGIKKQNEENMKWIKKCIEELGNEHTE